MKTLLKMKLQRKMLVEQQRARAQKGKIDSQASQTSAAHAGIVMDLCCVRACVRACVYVCVCVCACVYLPTRQLGLGFSMVLWYLLLLLYYALPGCSSTLYTLRNKNQMKKLGKY